MIKKSFLLRTSWLLESRFKARRARNKEFKGRINQSDMLLFFYFFFRNRVRQHYTECLDYAVNCGVTRLCSFLPLATASCASGEASRQMSSRWGKFSTAARSRLCQSAAATRSSPLGFPLRDIIAQCDSALSLRYHGEVKVPGRGHVINRQLFDSSLWCDSRLYRSLRPS